MLSKNVNGQDLVQHFTDAGQLTGYSQVDRGRNKIAARHYDAAGKLVGHSQEAEMWSSKLLRHFDATGRELGYSQWKKNLLVHFDSRGKEIGHSRDQKEQGYLSQQFFGFKSNVVHSNTGLPIPFLASRIYNACYQNSGDMPPSTFSN